MTDEIRATEAAAEPVQGNEGSEGTEIAPEPVPASPGEDMGPLDALRAGMADLDRIRGCLDQQIVPPGTNLAEITALLVEISGKLDRLLAPKIRAEQGAPVKASEIIERYRALGHLGATASEFGISTQRVHQVVSKFEKQSGVRLPRFKYQPPRKSRVEWRCAGCGLVRKLTPSSAANSPERCRSCEAKSRCRFTDEEISGFVCDLLRDSAHGKWTRLNRVMGYSQPNASQHRVFTWLKRRGRNTDIDALWPAGIPHWLRKFAEPPRTKVSAQAKDASAIGLER